MACADVALDRPSTPKTHLHRTGQHNMRTASVLVLCASLLVVADRPPKGDPTECEGAPPHMRRPAAGQCRLLREPRNGCGGSAQLREEDSAAGSEKYACEA